MVEMNNLEQVVERIRRCMEREDRKDVEFRALIALTELGDIVKYITHDPELNPSARPHGTRADEELAYGQALVQTIATMLLRNINIFQALEVGLKNWEEADWRRRERNGSLEEIRGRGVYLGKASGKAYVLSNKHPIEEIPDGVILVAPFITPMMTQYLQKVIAIVTDQGGITSHAAIIARELKIPCVVGTGDATQRILHDSFIMVEVTKKEGVVKK